MNAVHPAGAFRSEPDAAQTLLARSTGLRDSLRKIFGAMVGKEAIAPD